MLDAQLVYVHNVHKLLDKINMHDFQMNLENCNNIAEWMPGSSPILTEDELKRVFVLAMPKRWQVSYSNAGCSAATNMKVGLVTYFAPCEALAVNNTQMSEQCQGKSAHRDRQSGQNDDDNNDNDTSGKCQHQHNRFRHRSRSPSSSRRVAGSKSMPQLEDPCPLHMDLGERNHT